MSKLTRREFFSVLTLKSIKTAKSALALKNIAPNVPSLRAPGAATCAQCYATFDPVGDELVCVECRAKQARQQLLMAER